MWILLLVLVIFKICMWATQAAALPIYNNKNNNTIVLFYYYYLWPHTPSSTHYYAIKGTTGCMLWGSRKHPTLPYLYPTPKTHTHRPASEVSGVWVKTPLTSLAGLCPHRLVSAILRPLSERTFPSLINSLSFSMINCEQRSMATTFIYAL